MPAAGASLLEHRLRAAAASATLQRRSATHEALLVLIVEFLRSSGLQSSLASLLLEAPSASSALEAADNVDLHQIIDEWADAYERKHGRPPRLVRKKDAADSAKAGARRRSASVAALPPLTADVGAPSALPPLYRDAWERNGQRGDAGEAEEKAQLITAARRKKPSKAAPTSSASSTSAPSATLSPSTRGSKAAAVTETAVELPAVTGSTPLSLRPPPSPPTQASAAAGADVTVSSSSFPSSSSSSSSAPPRPPPTFSGVYLELARAIQRDILHPSSTLSTSFSDIVGLDSAKQLLHEAVTLPLLHPAFFTGLLSPWRGLLLYGPPGTGKTMLARAVACACHTTFFNIGSSTITSKYRGDSEKLVRVLFDLARFYAPSTVFIDEVDALMGSREGTGGEDGGGGEASRRMKSELLIQLDGLAQSEESVFVLCASNLPWDLDQALLRRLEKRILVPLPEAEARKDIVRRLLTDGQRARGLDYDAIASATERYSGSDLVSLCKESAMRPVRRLMKRLAVTADTEATAPPDAAAELEPVCMADVRAALACTRPSATVKYLDRYDEWHSQFGATVETDAEAVQQLQQEEQEP